MKNLFIFLLLSLMMISVASAEYEYGIYSEDVDFDFISDAGESSLAYLRDNYYGVLYLNDSNDLNLRVIEVDGTSIIDNNVYEVNLQSTYASKDLKLISVDNSTGVCAISYIYKHPDDYLHIVRSFDTYNNGTIRLVGYNAKWNACSGNFHTGDIFFTGNDFVTVSLSSVWAYFTYGSVSGAAVLSRETSATPRVSMQESSSESPVSLINCKFYYKHTDGEGYYGSPSSCSSSYASGNHNNCIYGTGHTGTQFEGNEIYNLDATYDEEGGFIYMTYSETLDKYPVVAVRNVSSNTLLDKQRLFDDTTTYNKVYTLSENYLLINYILNDTLYAESYSVGLDGTLTQEYEQAIYGNSGYNDLIKLPTTYDNYLLSFEDYDDLSIQTLGIGIIPPPEPEDTQVTIKDERTLEDFDTSDLTLTFYAHCENKQNYQTTINETTTSISVDCDYNSFSIKVEFEDESNTTYNYRRYYLRDLTDTYEQFDLNVYLINPYDTDFVYNEIIIDDLNNNYVNAQVFFEKNINGVTTQITAYNLDIQNSMMAILMNGESYDVYVDADEISKEYLGAYIAPKAGISSESTIFHLYDVVLKADFTRLNNLIEYQIYTENNQIEYNVKTTEEMDNNIINVTFSLYEGTPESGTLLYNESVGASEYSSSSLYSLLSGGPFNYTTYENETVYGKLHIWFVDDGEIRQTIYTTPLWTYNKITLPLTEYVNQEFIDWFILILLSVIALYATIQTANMASLGIIGIASLFVMFGWFSLSSGTLAIAALISLISMLKKREEGIQ